MGCLVQRGSSQLVTAPADPALHIGLTGLVAPGRQAKVCTNVARSAEAIRPIDRRAERKCGEWPDTLHGHQSPARWLDTNLVEHTFRENPGPLVWRIMRAIEPYGTPTPMLPVAEGYRIRFEGHVRQR